VAAGLGLLHVSPGVTMWGWGVHEGHFLYEPKRSLSKWLHFLKKKKANGYTMKGKC
jgi:hypothetical protein